MAKRSIQSSRSGYVSGVEYDGSAIRAARLVADGRGGYAVNGFAEVRGDFSADTGLIEGLRQIRGQLGIGARDAVVTCLAGKQVYAAEMDFRNLPPDELEQALRLELRKTVHFEVATSTLDFEILESAESSGGGVARIMVALAGNSLLNRQLTAMERAGIKVAAVEVLPLGIANALRAWYGSRESGLPMVGLHLGPQTATIVIDSEFSHFFNRTIHMASGEPLSSQTPPAERERQYRSLAEEIIRSLTFYEKSYQAGGFKEVTLLGDVPEEGDLQGYLQTRCNLNVRVMDLAGKMESARGARAGQYDLAIALALRGEP